MNGTGPEGKGPGTGRGLGRCQKDPKDNAENKLGKGMGKRRKAPGGGEGRGKRLNYGPQK
ncbi:MAG: DUF5320 family protein [Bacteroidales bacterium]|nr:DUF5320 family protein [Bacteroidales bacterium]